MSFKLKIKTERLIITEFTMDMAEAVHMNSLDEDNRRFVPDEVFETVEEAADTICFLMEVYKNGDGPLVYPVLLKDGTYIGYVQAVPFEDSTWEVGYHIGSNYTKKGYATEAMKALCQRAFAGKLFEKKETSYKYLCRKKTAKPEVIRAMIRTDNLASCQLAEKCGFQHMGTLQRHFLVENRYAVNCEIYELSREQFSDM